MSVDMKKCQMTKNVSTKLAYHRDDNIILNPALREILKYICSSREIYIKYQILLLSSSPFSTIYLHAN